MTLSLPLYNQVEFCNHFETWLRLLGLPYDLDPSLEVAFSSFQVLTPPPCISKHAAMAKDSYSTLNRSAWAPQRPPGPSCETLHSVAFHTSDEGESIGGRGEQVFQ